MAVNPVLMSLRTKVEKEDAVKARRKLLPCVTDRVLNDVLCFGGELTLGVHKIPFLEFSPTTALSS
jgi:hypothetical protein